MTRVSVATAVRARCWPLAPLVASNVAGALLGERSVTAPVVLRDLALVGELPERWA